MASIPADALMDEEIVDARDLKRRSLSLPELAMPAEKHAKLNPQSHMCEDTSKEMETSESKAAGATSEEELVAIETPAKECYYIDRVSGDVLLHHTGRGSSRKHYSFLGGNFLVVDCDLYDRMEFNHRLVCAVRNEPYEGSELEGQCEGVTVIDLIQMNNLCPLPPPPRDQDLRNFLDHYVGCLEKKVGEILPDREKVTEYLVSHRKDIDLFMGMKALCEGMEGSVVCAHYRNGHSQAPTLMYLKHGLKVSRLRGD